jgi:sigma-B regulation protein RsbU (phosphoserine phosphatase)
MSLKTGKPDAARIKALEKTIALLKKGYADLEKKCDEQAEHLAHECEFRDQQAEELRLAEVIIDKSPVILFRRIAGEEPRLV